MTQLQALTMLEEIGIAEQFYEGDELIEKIRRIILRYKAQDEADKRRYYEQKN